MKLLKAMATVAGLTGLSRVAGFLRDILTATMIGAGPMADAFFVALKLPNFFRRITAEGAFSVSFVPLYSETLEKEGEEKAAEFANNTLAVMLWPLVAFTLICVVLMPYVIYLIAPGFMGDVSRYPMTVDMSRVTFPYLLLMSVAALMGGMLNAHHRFAPFAAAPIIFNLSLVVFLLASGLFKTPGHAMSWGVFAAGILQCMMLYHFLKKAGLSLKFTMAPDYWDTKVGRLLKLMGPGVLGAGVMQINLFADLIIASFLETGSISFLYYADRLNQMPLSMVGIAVGTALLPMLSRTLASGDHKEAHNLFNRALEICMVLALPAAVGLFMASFPIIVTLFQHGAFGSHSAKMTTAVLTAYSIGIPAYVAVKVFSTAFWARQDTLTPVKAAIASALFNIAVAIFLITYAKVGVVGIAVATALAGWVQIILLSRGLKDIAEARPDKRFIMSLIKIIISCVLMGTYIYFVKGYFLPYYFQDDGTIYKVLGLAVIVGGGGLVYLAGIIAMGVIKVSDIKNLFSGKREKRKPAQKTAQKKADNP